MAIVLIEVMIMTVPALTIQIIATIVPTVLVMRTAYQPMLMTSLRDCIVEAGQGVQDSFLNQYTCNLDHTAGLDMVRIHIVTEP